MKKILLLLLSLTLAFSLTACGEPEKEVEISSDALLSALSNVSTMDKTIIYDEDTDPNENLGRPEQYIGKASFSDSRCEQILEDNLEGGTFEYFETKEDCNARHEYLLAFDDPSMGAFGLKQYIYKYSTVILRLTHELTIDEAEEYRNVMSEYLGEEPTQNYE